VRAHSAPYFRFGFAHVVAAAAAFKKAFRKVSVFRVYALEIFHKKSM